MTYRNHFGSHKAPSGRPTLYENRADCERCGHRISVKATRMRWCAPCQKILDEVNAVRPEAPIVVRHIAGYVPPKGSIAALFLGHVVTYS